MISDKIQFIVRYGETDQMSYAYHGNYAAYFEMGRTEWLRKLGVTYKKMEEDVMFEKISCDDAEYLLVAFGSSSRICQKAVDVARAQGIKVGLLRPITLFPFPNKAIQDMIGQVKGILSIEMNTGQMVEDIRLAVEGKVPVEFYGRVGGIIPSPTEIVEVLKNKLIGG